MRLFAFLVRIYFVFTKAVKKYKRFKEKPKGAYCCDECSHKIQLEAIKNFLDNFTISIRKKFDNKSVINYHIKKLIFKA